jgi:hypothetical protein
MEIYPYKLHEKHKIRPKIKTFVEHVFSMKIIGLFVVLCGYPHKNQCG